MIRLYLTVMEQIRSMFRGVYTITLCGMVAMLLLATASWADTVTLITSPAALSPNDSTNWAQLGPDKSIIPNGATATSSGGNLVTLTFGGSNGLVAVECPDTTCTWFGGFTPGETLVWANDGKPEGSASGPLTLTFQNAVTGAGLDLQAARTDQMFTGNVQALFTDGTMSSVFTVDSDADADPVYLGLLDQNGAGIKAITFDVTNSLSDHDFAAGTLDIAGPTTTAPEPSSFLLLGSGLVGLAWMKFRS